MFRIICIFLLCLSMFLWGVFDPFNLLLKRDGCTFVLIAAGFIGFIATGLVIVLSGIEKARLFK